MDDEINNGLNTLDKDTKNFIFQKVMENRCPKCYDDKNIKYHFDLEDEENYQFTASCCGTNIDIPKDVIIEKIKIEFSKVDKIITSKSNDVKSLKVISKDFYDNMMKYIESLLTGDKKPYIKEFLQCYNLCSQVCINSGDEYVYALMRFILSIIPDDSFIQEKLNCPRSSICLNIRRICKYLERYFIHSNSNRFIYTNFYRIKVFDKIKVLD